MGFNQTLDKVNLFKDAEGELFNAIIILQKLALDQEQRTIDSKSLVNDIKVAQDYIVILDQFKDVLIQKRNELLKKMKDTNLIIKNNKEIKKKEG